MGKQFIYEKAAKTKSENDFLNLQSYLFITAKTITSFFYFTRITPHQVILLSMILGIAASYLIIQNNKAEVITGALFLFYKNVLDKVDGSLARAKDLDSRRGRFYDSISDFIVTVAAFSAISYKLFVKYDTYIVFLIGFTAMLSSMLQCSYFVYYQVSFIKHTGKNTINRIIESVTEDDIKNQDPWSTFLQKVFMLIYGWQDIFFAWVDKVLFNRLPSFSRQAWYQNKPFLTMASSLSIGTHIFLICISAIFDIFEFYLFMNLICMNLLLILSIIYHYKSTKSAFCEELNKS